MHDEKDTHPTPIQPDALKKTAGKAKAPPLNDPVPEIGGPAGPEPTRYGDWERKGRVSDF